MIEQYRSLPIERITFVTYFIFVKPIEFIQLNGACFTIGVFTYGTIIEIVVYMILITRRTLSYIRENVPYYVIIHSIVEYSFCS
jgi:hypothetical protein